MISLVPQVNFESLKQDFDIIHGHKQMYNGEFISLPNEIFFDNFKNIENNFRRICYDIAVYAQVPHHYLGAKKSGKVIDRNIMVTRSRQDRGLCIYFNRLGKYATSEGHGHIIIDQYGEIIYYRPIGMEHGMDNFVDQPRLLPPAKNKMLSDFTDYQIENDEAPCYA